MRFDITFTEHASGDDDAGTTVIITEISEEGVITSHTSHSMPGICSECAIEAINNILAEYLGVPGEWVMVEDWI